MRPPSQSPSGLLVFVFVCMALTMTSCHRSQTQSLPDATKPAKVHLAKRPGQGSIHALQVRVEGDIDGKATLKFAYPGEPLPRTFSISGAFAKSVHAGDWYADTMELEYEPEAVTRGSVRFVFEFAD